MAKKVLIVDDEKHILKILTFYLQEICDEVVQANNGKEAYDLISTSDDIDLVLSDINMPVMTGIELIKKVREEENNIKFVFFTAYGNESFMVEALKYGASDFIKKTDIDNLSGVIQGILDEIDTPDQFVSAYKKMLGNEK